MIGIFCVVNSSFCSEACKLHVIGVGPIKVNLMNNKAEINLENTPLILLDQCAYTPHYCEENVWKLADKIRLENNRCLQYCYVVFVSNQNCLVPLWKQKAGKDVDGLVVWDYHVFLIYEGHNTTWVFDLDTLLQFPARFVDYFIQTFKSDDILKPEFHRLFRVISASEYLEKFASDRRHMKNEDETWIKSPPPWLPITTESDVHNLPEFISMELDVHGKSKHGTVYNLTDFYTRFIKPQSQSV